MSRVITALTKPETRTGESLTPISRLSNNSKPIKLVARLKYYDGTKIQVGDAITVEGNQGIKIPAVVLKIVEPRTEDAEQWNLPTGGVLMEGGGLGTFVSSYLEKDNEIVFVHRAE